jgi:predicted PurR-regulated permease PerM
MKLIQTKLRRYRVEILFLLICLMLIIIGIGLAQSLSNQKTTLANKINDYQDFKLKIAEAKYISEFSDEQPISKISQFLSTQNLTFYNEGNSFEIIDIDPIAMKAITDYLASLNIKAANVEGIQNNSSFTVRFIVE